MRTILLSFLILTGQITLGQTTRVAGRVTDEKGQSLAGVSIVVSGTVNGTITNLDGHYSLTVKLPPPITLVFSMIGFSKQEVVVEVAELDNLDIILKEEPLVLGQEIVVSASRVEQSILESPVSVEKMGVLAIGNAASDSYYKSIANLKGVDMTTSSINFQVFNARGFNSTGNTRFVQLIDGMDTQAPALNFPIGNLTGPSDLDLESIEFIPGASSALYGPNAFNGMLLITSRNPFEYQGLSAYYKQGFNHFGNSNLNSLDPLLNPSNQPLGPGSVQPMFEGSLRYARAFKNRFAFKVNFTFSKATDWYGTSLNDRNFLSQPAGLDFNPGADRLHAYGDEVALSLGLLAANPAFSALAAQLGLDARQLPNVVVSRTPYAEEYLVDYNAKNLKGSAGLYYRLNNKLELSYNYIAGYGTTVYTGVQRYSLANFNIQQHKLELRSPDFFVRAYGTFENSGDSYIADLTGIMINDAWQDNETWFGIYGLTYLLATQSGSDPQLAHTLARNAADQGRFEPGSTEFEQAKRQARSQVVPNGARFADQSQMFHLEGQYNLSNRLGFMELLTGASYRLYRLRSNGTIFADTPGHPITISEYGAFVQGGKALLHNKLKLLASLRFDKNENFRGQLSPRLSAVVKPARDHNIRLSFQTGFRNPTTQGQHIDLNVVAARLIGGLDYYRQKYNIFENAYSARSVEAFIDAVAATGDPLQIGNPEILGLLEPVTGAPELKPEKVTSFEVGYKSLINNKLLIDLAVYYNLYRDFITQIQVRKAGGAIIIPQGTSNDPNDANYWGYHPLTEQNIRNAQLLLTPITTPGKENTFQTYTNFEQRVTAGGLALGLDYNLGKGFVISGNYNWNRLIQGLGPDFLNDFNTPEHKYNLSLSNRKLAERWGFNITWRWQSAFRWEAGFGRGDVPAVGTLDAQVNYRLPAYFTTIKAGGSNILNQRYVLSYGGPTLGAIYYITITFENLLK